VERKSTIISGVVLKKQNGIDVTGAAISRLRTEVFG
jgi:hypothetical protein